MSREEAFRALVGAGYSGEAMPFPEQIVLPDLIHARALAAANATTADQRERSVHFRHKSGRWDAGPTFRGRKSRLKMSQHNDGPGFHMTGKSNRLHVGSTLVFPPHLHLHTHPPGSEGMVETMVADVKEDFRAPLESLISAMLTSMVLLPSFGDIWRTLTAPAGSVAHLLASKWGSFLWVHRDITATKDPPESVLWTILGRDVYPEPTDDDITDQEPDLDLDDDLELDPKEFAQKVADYVEDFWPKAINSRVHALNKAYVCYMVRDPEDATLCRVRSADFLKAS
jgi:hypothetical protein